MWKDMAELSHMLKINKKKSVNKPKNRAPNVQNCEFEVNLWLFGYSLDR